MYYSKHSLVRSKQRGIKPEVINLIINEGNIKNRPGNAFEFSFSNKKIEELIKKYKYKINLLEKSSRVSVILSEEDTIITTYHKK